MWPQQRWGGAMECYVGLDVSLKQTSICVVNEKGSVVREGVVDSVPEAIAGFVRSKAPGAVRIGLETGPTATWLWTELARLDLPVICIDARHAKAVLKMQVNKNDRNDAAGIARIMQTAGSRKCASRTLIATLSRHCWRAERCWSRSSAILRTRSVACSRTLVLSSAMARSTFSPCGPKS